MTLISIVAAVAQNGVIGQGLELPFRLKTDMQHFKSVTMGKPVVMGRKTFDSIGKALPKRRNIVVTRQSDWVADNVEIASSIQQAIDLCMGENEICIIGGGEIYRQAMPLAQQLTITHVKRDADGDIVFPHIDLNIWQETSRKHAVQGEQDDASMDFVTYQRI